MFSVNLAAGIIDGCIRAMVSGHCCWDCGTT